MASNFETLTKLLPEANKENLRRWRDALADPNVKQSTDSELYNRTTGCMCVLGVGFKEFFPNEFQKVVVENVTRQHRLALLESRKGNIVEYNLEYDWDRAVYDILGTDIGAVTFYSLNDSGFTFQEFIELFDEALNK